jgi:hypothetical protein
MNDPIFQALMGAWECALAGSEVTYLSGPITTGPRLLAALRAGANLDERALIEVNCREMRAAADGLRADGRDAIVVEPGSLSVTGWTQSDYIGLWEHFIERFATAIVFMPGWELSAGCAREYARAMEKGLLASTLSGSPLLPAEGRVRLAAALKDIEPYGRHPSIARLMEAITSALDRLSRGAA